jgi:acyl carrier protein
LPRVLGVAALARALEGQPLDFCHVASSLASILGGVGRAAYAATTSYLDAFAAAERYRSPVAWTSVAWDAWQSDAGQANPFGDLAISRDEGGAAFLALLGLDAGPRVAVATTSLRRRLAPAKPHSAAAAAVPSASSSLGTGEAAPRPALANAFVAPTTEVEVEIARIWQEALGIAEVGIHDNFFDLGGNSLVGVRLIARLTERFGVPIRAVAIYEGPTVHALSGLIAGGDRPSESDAALAASRGARRRAKRQRQTLGEPE